MEPGAREALATEWAARGRAITAFVTATVPAETVPVAVFDHPTTDHPTTDHRTDDEQEG